MVGLMFVTLYMSSYINPTPVIASLVLFSYKERVNVACICELYWRRWGRGERERERERERESERERCI